MATIREQLAAPMDYKWRVQSAKYGKATCVAYVDARDVMNRLDDVFGVDGWSDHYNEHKGNLFCSITAFYNDETGEFTPPITKTDCGTESNVEKQKGEASDAFKRAAVKWGVGRFLYDLDMIELKTAKHNNKDYPCDNNGNIIWGKDNLNDYINDILKKGVKPKVVIPKEEKPKDGQVGKKALNATDGNRILSEFKAGKIKDVKKYLDDNNFSYTKTQLAKFK